jgi:hypothetical protein
MWPQLSRPFSRIFVVLNIRKVERPNDCFLQAKSRHELYFHPIIRHDSPIARRAATCPKYRSFLLLAA